MPDKDALTKLEAEFDDTSNRKDRAFVQVSVKDAEGQRYGTYQ